MTQTLSTGVQHQIIQPLVGEYFHFGYYLHPEQAISASQAHTQLFIAFRVLMNSSRITIPGNNKLKVG